MRGRDRPSANPTDAPEGGQTTRRSSQPGWAIYHAVLSSLYTRIDTWIESFKRLCCSQRFARQPQISNTCSSFRTFDLPGASSLMRAIE